MLNLCTVIHRPALVGFTYTLLVVERVGVNLVQLCGGSKLCALYLKNTRRHVLRLSWCIVVDKEGQNKKHHSRDFYSSKIFKLVLSYISFEFFAIALGICQITDFKRNWRPVIEKINICSIAPCLIFEAKIRQPNNNK